MTIDESIAERISRASDDLRSFHVANGIYLVGSLERGVTVYKQQVRAHNLAWAMWELHRAKELNDLNRIAIVGGGIAGLTTAACLLSLIETASVTIFEKLWDLCPLQQGSDNRWLHPRIYDWPSAGSRAPSASLPVLNWTEGRASDVSRSVLSEFRRFSTKSAEDGHRLEVLLGVRHLRVSAAEKAIEWEGHATERVDGFFRVNGDSVRDSKHFDAIIMTAGFGLEETVSGFSLESYWRNEQLGQPNLNGTQERYLISGYGDGALTDLFRLTIERFRQDTILYEIFEDRLDEVENYFCEAWPEGKHGDNAYELFVESEKEWLTQALERLSCRIRKDTRVTLHIRGRDGSNNKIEKIFARSS